MTKIITPPLLLQELIIVPQVILLSCLNLFFKITVNAVIKKVICLEKTCGSDHYCHNCLKFNSNLYLPLQWYVFDQKNYLKKELVQKIISDYSITSLSVNTPKILVLEQVQYCTLEAGNSFLKFLENVPQNTYIILVSNNLELIMPTIKSRCQVITTSIADTRQLQKQAFKTNENEILLLHTISICFNFDISQFTVVDLKNVLKLIMEFIINDKEKNIFATFLLIKKLLLLKQKSILFFYLLLFFTKQKLFLLNSNNERNRLINNILIRWTNNDKLFLLHLLETVIIVIARFDNKINLSLLFNYFFITIYGEGKKDEQKSKTIKFNV